MIWAITQDSAAARHGLAAEQTVRRSGGPLPFSSSIRESISGPSLVEARLIGTPLITASLIRTNLIKQGWKIVIECPGS